jgi:S-adenosylmethionine decarboxylase proenzyme
MLATAATPHRAAHCLSELADLAADECASDPELSPGARVTRPAFPPHGTAGRHLLVEYNGCDPRCLDDIATVEALLLSAARAAGATVVASTFHRFAPSGVSGVVVVMESHLSIHTWPEHGYAAVDFYTCGACSPERAHALLRAGLGARGSEVLMVRRGQGRPVVLQSPAPGGDSRSEAA